jgi:pimeloyl-ACP methyl ester carboxylesterase
MPRTRRSDLHDRLSSLATLVEHLLTFLAVFAMEPARADEPAKPASRAEATAIIANARKIVTPNGVERSERVRVGGIDQWVSIRGTDRGNPVLLYIHGGPGYVSIPMSWWFNRGCEEYFTIVQWDQRAAGKTHLLTDPATIAPTLTRERMVTDAEEMAAWVRREFGKNKIFVLGHSWGSFLGLQLAKHRPEWLHAYIGVSQLIDGPENERRGWRFALDSARRAGNVEAVRELEAIAPTPPPVRSSPSRTCTSSANGSVFMAALWPTGAIIRPTARSPGSHLTTVTRKSAAFGKAMSSPPPICCPSWSRSISPRSVSSRFR